jgi:CBS domain-containing protein
MSPRAAWRLEALGFEHVYEYVAGKADWLAHGLPREGTNAGVLYAGDLLDSDPPTCRPGDELDRIRDAMGQSRYGFCLVVNDEHILLGRLRKTALEHADDRATAEALMEAGPSTVRPDTPAAALVERLAKQDLKTAIVTDPEGRLLGSLVRRNVDLAEGDGFEPSRPVAPA